MMSDSIKIEQWVIKTDDALSTFAVWIQSQVLFYSKALESFCTFRYRNTRSGLIIPTNPLNFMCD